VSKKQLIHISELLTKKNFYGQNGNLHWAAKEIKILFKSKHAYLEAEEHLILSSSDFGIFVNIEVYSGVCGTDHIPIQVKATLQGNQLNILPYQNFYLTPEHAKAWEIQKLKDLKKQTKSSLIACNKKLKELN
jgi:hypothetical protein